MIPEAGIGRGLHVELINPDLSKQHLPIRKVERLICGEEIGLEAFARSKTAPRAYYELRGTASGYELRSFNL